MKHQSRKEKIRFLKNIEAGRESIDTLYPVNYVSCNQREDEPDRIVISETGEEMTSAQFQAWKKTLPRNTHLTILILPGDSGKYLLDYPNAIRL